MKLIMFGPRWKEVLERCNFRWIFRNLFEYKITNENYFSEKNSVLNAEITNYPKFSVEPIGKDLFESKERD
jgi:hypothetical protein